MLFPLDVAQPIGVPVLYDSRYRLGRWSTAVAELFHLPDNPRYLARPIEGVDCTFCNFAFVEQARVMGCSVPQKTANELAEWFPATEAIMDGWFKVAQDYEAQVFAERGWVVAAVVAEAGHGHIARLVPAPPSAPPANPGVWLCQAGRSNFTCAPLTAGFDTLVPSFYVHS